MTKDRAGPFSRKHRRYWLPVTGGMILIMVVNVGLGFWLYDTTPRKLPVVKPVPRTVDAGVALPLDAGADAAPASVP